jgi:diguanylate cyclase (GGDEF)-like protein/PAS domain S-box-containing protein
MNSIPSPASSEKPSGSAGPFARLGRAFRRGLVDAGIEQLNMRWRFRLVVLVFGWPFLAYIVWSATQQAALEKEQVRERTRASATLVAARFEDEIQHVDRMLATLSQALGGRIDDAAAVDGLIQSMRGYIPKASDNIGLWALDGRIIASLDRRSGTRAVNNSDRQYFRDAIAHRDLAIQGPIASRSTQVDIIQFARPVFDARNEPIAVITMSIRSNELIGQLDSGHTVGAQALVTILDDRGIIVARSSEAGFWVRKQGFDPTAIKAAFAQRTGTLEEVGVDGLGRLVGYAVVPTRPWIVMVGEPIDEVTGPIATRLLQNLAIGLFILFLALFTAGRVASWTIAPMLQLSSDAERLGAGDLSHRSRVATGGEIATLADNFNRMAAAVEERDAALTRSRHEVNESQKRLLTITDNVPAMICYLDEHRCFRFANSVFEDWFKRPLSEIVGQPMDRLMIPEIAAEYDRYFRQCMQGETVDFEVEVPSLYNGPRWLKGTFIPDIDEATGKVCGVYGLIHNATKAKVAEQNLMRLAQFDSLTGLANRNQFNEILARVLAADDHFATDGVHCALMFLDIDHFKLINDRLGHAAGDHLLKEFAQRLAGSVRPSDTVARLSGDEFVVLLQDMHSDEPQFIARKIIAAVEKPFVLEGQVMNVTASIGIAMRAHVGETPSAIMKRADEALYEAKRAGRNTFRLAS